MNEEEIGFDPTRTGDPLIGATLGEYVVRERLGEGGIGVIYRGEQPLIGKPVAIKVLRPEYSDDPKQAQKFIDEARAVNAAHHPNIIDVYGFGTTRHGQQYLVMEVLDGEPLDVYLRSEGGKLGVEDALELLKQVASGLQAAHAAGVIHRDLKPGNLFVVRLADGTRFIKLLDFGLAKRALANGTARPTANIVVGTPLYMAPEQVSVGDVSAATDLYALGCIAYELVSGKPPFMANSVMQLLEMHTSGVAERLVLDGVPEAYWDLVFELLRKDMKARPQSAAEVKRRLELLERQVLPPPTTVHDAVEAAPRATRIRPAPQVRDTPLEPVVPPTAPQLTAPPRRRWPWFVGAAAVLPMVLVAGIYIGEQQEPAPLPPPQTRIAEPTPPAPQPTAPSVAEAPSVAPVQPAEPPSAPPAPGRPHPAPKEHHVSSAAELATCRAHILDLHSRMVNLTDDRKRLAKDALDFEVAAIKGPNADCLAELKEIEAKYWGPKK